MKYVHVSQHSVTQMLVSCNAKVCYRVLVTYGLLVASCVCVVCSQPHLGGFKLQCHTRQTTSITDIITVSGNIWGFYKYHIHVYNPVFIFFLQNHFRSDQYEGKRIDGRRKLLPNATPTEFAHRKPSKPRRAPLARSAPSSTTDSCEADRSSKEHNYSLKPVDGAACAATAGKKTIIMSRSGIIEMMPINFD